MSVQPEDTIGGLSHLIKSATPIVGRVGAVLGGIIGLLTALEKLSGEIITTLEGFLLVVAIVASSVVVWGRHTRTVNGQPLTLPLYPRKHRTVAAAVLALAGILTVLFIVRIGSDYFRAQDRERLANVGRQTRVPPLTRVFERATERATPAVVATNVTPTPPALSAGTLTPTPATSQITDVSLLNGTGFQAIATKNYTQALTIFQRALQIDATNAQSQLGLGEALYFTAQYSPAILPLRTALQLNPSLVDAHFYLGLVYENQRDFVRARVEYEEFLRVAPKDNPLRNDATDALKRMSTPTRPGATAAPTR